VAVLYRNWFFSVPQETIQTPSQWHPSVIERVVRILAGYWNSNAQGFGNSHAFARSHGFHSFSCHERKQFLYRSPLREPGHTDRGPALVRPASVNGKVTFLGRPPPLSPMLD
jgi:hypothetical protein